jgi:hypothetical protein
MDDVLDGKTVTTPSDAEPVAGSERSVLRSSLSNAMNSLTSAGKSVSTASEGAASSLSRDVAPAFSPPKPRKKGYFRIIKIVVILAVLGFVIYKVHPMLSAVMGLYSMFTSFGGSNKQFNKETKGLSAKKEKPKKPKMKGVPSGTPNLSKQTIIPKKSNGVKYKTPPAMPAPDDTMSEIQHKTSQPGSCYVGKWKGYRSCINVKDPRDCYSGEIYPSQEECVHPKTRV